MASSPGCWAADAVLTRLPGARPVLAVLAATLVLASCGTASEDEAGAPAASGSYAASDEAPAVDPGIGVEEFQERTERADVVVLDVRTSQEYAAGHLPGAVNLDASAADFAARVAELDPSATYAVYCASGNRSGAALAHLREVGFTDAEHLAGGIGAWQAAGGRVVTR